METLVLALLVALSAATWLFVMLVDVLEKNR
jgi:hypothetical protein